MFPPDVMVGKTLFDAQKEYEYYYELLCEFQDIFSTGPQDLGKTELTKHVIDTGAAAPYRQPPRR